MVKKHKTYKDHVRDMNNSLIADFTRADIPNTPDTIKGMLEATRLINELNMRDLVEADYECGDYCGWDTINERPYPCAKHIKA